MTTTRHRLAAATGAAALAAAALLTTAGPASAYNPCQGDEPPPRCYTPVPIPAPRPPATTSLETAAFVVGPQFFNGNDHNQWQQTTASLVIVHDAATGAELRAYIHATTRTRSDDALAGFHASASVTAGPSYFATAPHRFGVDGAWIGTSDRTDSWDEDVPLDRAKGDRGGTLYTHSTFG